MSGADRTIALIGCGRMGTALLRGWIASNAAARIDVVEPGGLPEEFAGNPVIVHHADASGLTAPDIAVLAVKPQAMEQACETLRPVLRADTLLLSIAAGQALSAFARRFGARQPVVRSMPNTPAAIGMGITVAVAGANVSEKQKADAHALLCAGGAVEWIGDENLLDAVTALSGSGPAYVFLLIEAMAGAGENAGLPRDLAQRLARATVIGSAALADKDRMTSAEALRNAVTSPGGTTAAALDVLMKDGAFAGLMTRAIQAAADRSRALRDQ